MLTLARYHKVRRALAPFLVTSLAVMFVVAFVERPEQVAMATLVIPLVVALRRRLSRHRIAGAFLADIFLWGFLLRACLGLIILHFELWEFYGGDSTTYDFWGWELSEHWHGRTFGSNHLFNTVLTASNPGIIYVTAAFCWMARLTSASHPAVSYARYAAAGAARQPGFLRRKDFYASMDELCELRKQFRPSPYATPGTSFQPGGPDIRVYRCPRG